MVNLKLYIGLRMVRMIPVAVFALLLLLLILTSATATATTVSVGSAAITEGGSTIIPLQIENAATEISCATILLSYDSTIARVTEVSNGDFDKLVYNADDAQGQTTLVVYQTGASGLSGTIKIGDLTLAGINAGTTSLVPQITTLKDNGGNSISADVAIGTFTVRSAGGSGGSSGGSSGGGGTSTPSPTPTPSTMPSTSPSLTPTPSSVSATAIPRPSGSAESGFITVHSAAVRAGKGDEVTVPIMISDVGGEGLSSARITLTYDPKVVNVLNAENSDFDEFVSNIEKGQVRMIGFQTGLEGLTGDVTFAQLHLKAVGRDGTTSALGLEVQELVDNHGILLVEEHNDYEVQAGSFTVGSAGEPETVSESSNSLVFVIGIVGMLLAVIIGFYLFVLLKRRSS
jgi:hypothetical protein